MISDFDLMKVTNEGNNEKPKPEMYNYYFGGNQSQNDEQNQSKYSKGEHEDKNVIPCQINLNSQVYQPRNNNMNSNIDHNNYKNYENFRPGGQGGQGQDNYFQGQNQMNNQKQNYNNFDNRFNMENSSMPVNKNIYQDQYSNNNSNSNMKSNNNYNMNQMDNNNQKYNNNNYKGNYQKNINQNNHMNPYETGNDNFQYYNNTNINKKSIIIYLIFRNTKHRKA
jgi:hypothetical protein